ncbi:tail fiber protein [Photorhabdus akhurstii]|uniref:tail fiber protein n=1 Tax=Photorhabdus akhurstii TaxID=171438 RepID=UPI001FE367D6|nr:phage tail protein [Photorhabdus akhurstii]
MELAKSAVPSSRKVNGKPLTEDVSLNAGDVGAYSKSESDNKFARGSVDTVETTGTYPRIYFKPPADKKNRGHFGIEASLNYDDYQSIYLYKRKASGENIFVTNFPQKYGTLATIDDINAANNIPVGSPIPWPQPNPPSGYLTCNGQAFNKSLYPQLAVAYPSGKLPDLRGEFIRGWDDGRGVDRGRGILSWQPQQVQWHQHVSGYGGWGGEFGATTGGRNKPGSYHGDGKQFLPFTNNGADFENFSNSGLVGNETRPRNIAFNYIVRAA